MSKCKYLWWYKDHATKLLILINNSILNKAVFVLYGLFITFNIWPQIMTVPSCRGLNECFFIQYYQVGMTCRFHKIWQIIPSHYSENRDNLSLWITLMLNTRPNATTTCFMSTIQTKLRNITLISYPWSRHFSHCSTKVVTHSNNL